VEVIEVKIEVIGPGCPRCDTTEENARRALAELSLAAELVHVYDVKEFARRGVVLTPAVVVDGEVKVSGRVPSVDELKAMFVAGSGR
jgi:small redox-active disulfide protein 2